MTLDRSRLDTERADPATAALDRLTTLDAVRLVNAADTTIAAAVAAAAPAIARAIDLTAERLARGGRLLYVGAGTSGRLALLDAVECPPTFSADPETVQAVLAGGDSAFTRAIEGAEDSPTAAADELRRRELSELDVVFGIAASGRTPFVHGALRYARDVGAGTVFLACVPERDAPDEAEVSIRVLTGPEVLAGSTRMKAGTATKMVLNTVTTLVMTRLGRVYENLMVDVNTAGNAKLVDRGRRLVAQIGRVPADAAAELLEAANGEVKTACVMARRRVTVDRARELLAASNGFLRGALALHIK